MYLDVFLLFFAGMVTPRLAPLQTAELIDLLVLLPCQTNQNPILVQFFLERTHQYLVLVRDIYLLYTPLLILHFLQEMQAAEKEKQRGNRV